MPIPNLKPFKTQQIPIKQNNIHLIQYSYKVKGGATNSTIKQAAKEVMANVQAKIKKEKMGLQGKLMVTQLYDNTIFWQSGKFTDFGDDPNFYDFAMEYEYKGEKLQDKFQNFNLTVKLFDPKGGCPAETESKLNDCLWYCLRDLYSGSAYMPKAINSQQKLKKQANTARTEPIHFANLESVAERIKANITVIGDVEKQFFDKTFKHSITVKLHDGHYTLPTKHTMDKQLRASTNHKNKPIVVYSESIDEDGKVVYKGCDGEALFTLDRDTLKAFWMRPMSSKVIYRRVDDLALGLREQHRMLVQDAEAFLKHSDGFVNFYRQLNEAKAAKFIFGKLNRTLIPPGRIGAVESTWIHEARGGGLIYGRPATLESAVCYDVNKMYPSMMMDYHFQIPTDAGTFTDTSTETINKYSGGHAYGLYKCRITNPNEVSAKLFKFKKSNVYTHWDLQTASEMGLVLTMSDQSPNTLLFKSRERGQQIFKPFVEYMVKVGSSIGALKVDRLKATAKKLLNSLWGVLCETATTKVDMNVETKLDLAGRSITHIEPYRDSVLIKLEKTEDKYKTSYARMLPFMTAYGRRKMYLALKDVEAHVYRIHTDGFVIDRPLDSLPLSTKIGEWKIEKQGRCQIFNAMKVEFN